MIERGSCKYCGKQTKQHKRIGNKEKKRYLMYCSTWCKSMYHTEQRLTEIMKHSPEDYIKKLLDSPENIKYSSAREILVKYKYKLIRLTKKDVRKRLNKELRLLIDETDNDKVQVIIKVLEIVTKILGDDNYATDK